MTPSNLILGAVGGVMIGLSASLLMLSHGRVAGISGMLGGLLDASTKDRAYRAWFLAGLVLVGLVLSLGRSEMLAPADATPLGVAAAAGLLVGFGTSLGNGCTSGHGVCGVSRLAKRSLVATATFLAAGAITVFITRLLLGGGQ